MKKIIILLLISISTGCFIVENLRYRIESNEAIAFATIRNIITTQVYELENNKKLKSNEELIKHLDLVDYQGNVLQKQGYKIEIQNDGRSFQIWLTPIKYSSTGKISYYFDSKIGIINGADHQGGKANANDAIILNISEEEKIILNSLISK